MKNTGELRNTQSRLPSSVLSLMENPRGLRARSELPASPPTVENLTVKGHSLPTVPKILAILMSLMLLEHLNTPWAPEPLEWTVLYEEKSTSLLAHAPPSSTYLSGILSRLKWDKSSIKSGRLKLVSSCLILLHDGHSRVSCNKTGPDGPIR